MTVEIIGHRGSPRARLENTLPSFAQAIAEGADGIELDVHLSVDGVVVVHHDAWFRSLVDAPDERRAIAMTSAAALGRLPLAGGEFIPTLEDVFGLAGDDVTVYVEVKALRMESELSAVLARWPRAKVAVHAFDHRIPVRVRERCPGLSIGLLSASYPLDIAAAFGSAAVDAVWQQADLIDAAFVRDVHRMGARVIAWTANDPSLCRELVAVGVDALCTDTPAVTRRALATLAG